jgi:hypothetical protein
MQAEQVRGLHVDHQLEFDRLHYRQIGGLRAPEDAIDVAGRAPVRVDRIRSIGG